MSTPQREWDGVAAGWRRWWQAIEGPSHAVSLRMLDLAVVAPGQRVLDIATGLGEPALSAATRVGPSGQVTGIDISPRMLAIARERAGERGLTNVTFIEADVERLGFADGTFEAILCRWGVTSLPNLPRTLEKIGHLLAPAGSFATAVWESGETGRPLAAMAMRAAREMFVLPPESPPSRPGLASEDLKAALIGAGFVAVSTVAMTIVLEFSSPGDCVQYLKDVSPDMATLLAAASVAEEAAYSQRLSTHLQAFTSADGSVRLPNRTICAVGRRCL